VCFALFSLPGGALSLVIGDVSATDSTRPESCRTGQNPAGGERARRAPRPRRDRGRGRWRPDARHVVRRV